MSIRVGFAIVGLGRFGLKRLIPALPETKFCRLAAVVSSDREKAKRVAQEYGVKEQNIYSYDDFDRIRDNSDVQVVYVALPNAMHCEFTERAARAGKHVLCEKPMEISSARCERMIDVCRRVGVKLMIGYRIQYEPLTRALQRCVRERTYGAPRFIDATYAFTVDSAEEWRLKRDLSGFGALGDIGIYCLNTIRFLLGEEPSEVMAQSFKPAHDPRFAELDATTLWQMRFPSGVLAKCATSFDSSGVNRCIIAAEKSTFGMEPAFSYSGLKLRADPNQPPLPEVAEQNQFVLEMDHMAECVLHDKDPQTPGEEGLRDVRIIETIVESARSGRAVKLSVAKE